MAIKLNPGKFGSAFVRRKAARMLEEFLEGLNKDGRGKERVIKMIEDNKRIDSLVPPDKLQPYLDLAKQYSWAANMISDQDIMNMLPAWVMAAVQAKGQPGFTWLQRQILWLRSIFKG